jgi:UDP-glucuronate 4-epimerase
LKKILVTGAAGFIGHALCKRLIETGFSVYGIDNINNYYDPNLKLDRLIDLGIDTGDDLEQAVISTTCAKFSFQKLDITDSINLFRLFEAEKFDMVVNLAAQAGVRYSIDNPETYIQSNIVGFANVLEACRQLNVEHLIYASSSSVYGNNKKVPFSVNDRVDKPISLYAATKKSNELMASSYSHLYDLRTTGLRFFTVYGPWGRPDMAIYKFTKAIFNEKKIEVYNYGDLSRDFTYITDIVDGVLKVITQPLINKNLDKIYNIGLGKPVSLMEFINTIQEAIGKEALIDYLPMQDGDVYRTYADLSEIRYDYNYDPKFELTKGVRNFVEWYSQYHNKIEID